MEHRSRTRLVTAVMLAVVFASAYLLGLASDTRLGAQPAQVVAEGQDGEASEGERRGRTRMYEQVGPTADQMVFIDSIVKDHRSSMDELHEEFWRSYYPLYQAVIQDTRGAIKDIFSEEQAAQYQVLLDDFDARKAAERDEKDERD